MERSIPITKARGQLTKLPEELDGKEAVRITRKGEPVLAVLPWELYEAVLETLEIMGDEEQMAQLREGMKAAGEGRTRSWDEAKKELGL